MAGRIVRGDVRLYSFAPPDKKRPVVVLTRYERHCLFLDCNRRTHYVCDSWRAI